MVQKVDPFEARLSRLKDQSEGKPGPRKPVTRTVAAPEKRSKRRSQDHSVFLPVAAMALLIVGGAAFGLMLFLPDVAGSSLATHVEAN